MELDGMPPHEVIPPHAASEGCQPISSYRQACEFSKAVLKLTAINGAGPTQGGTDGVPESATESNRGTGDGEVWMPGAEPACC